MNCIDAIEGTVKCIITRLHQVFVDDVLDDSEYIRNIKEVINGTDVFIQHNKEIVSDPQMLKQVLRTFAKDLWLKNLEKTRNKASDSDIKGLNPENDGYDDYYFEYIYNHDQYPR